MRSLNSTPAGLHIEFTPEAVEDLQWLRKHEQQRIVDSIEQNLRHEPDKETRNRKRLRPNRLAEWELRVSDCRVFYDVNGTAVVVKIVAIGIKKGNRLFIQGEEFEL